MVPKFFCAYISYIADEVKGGCQLALRKQRSHELTLGLIIKLGKLFHVFLYFAY